MTNQALMMTLGLKTKRRIRKMKKATKVLLAILALSLMICTLFALTASANEEAEPYATVLKKNVEYGSELYLYFGIDDTTAAGNDIEVLIYTENPTANPDATVFNATKSTLVYTPDPTKPVYRSFGIPASAVVDEFYIVPRVVGYDIDYSKMVTYSVIEYLLDMRLTSTDAEDIALYDALITYATAAQNKFDYKTNTLAKDFVYAEVTNGLFANGKASYLGMAGDTVTVTYNGTATGGHAQKGWGYTDADGIFVVLSETNDVILNTSTLLVPNMINTYIITPDNLTGTRGTGVYYEQSTKYGGNVAAPKPNAYTASAVLYGTDDEFVYYYKDISEGETNGQSHIIYENNVTVPEATPTRVLELDIAFGNFSNYTDTSRVGTAGFQISFYGGAEQSTVYFTGKDGKVGIHHTGNIVQGENISLDEGVWYTLRLESYDYTNDGVATKIIKVYVNNTWICDVLSADAGTSGAKNVRLTFNKFETDDWVAFDNVYNGYSADEFVAGAPKS